MAESVDEFGDLVASPPPVGTTAPDAAGPAVVVSGPAAQGEADKTRERRQPAKPAKKRETAADKAVKAKAAVDDLEDDAEGAAALAAAEGEAGSDAHLPLFVVSVPGDATIPAREVRAVTKADAVERFCASLGIITLGHKARVERLDG